MQTHPVPQNITGFEFKLVGFMTLRQFLYMAGAGIIGFVFFISIGSFIKWFLIVPIVLLALAAAFAPINGIPFDKWVLFLIHAVTSPAIRVWFKEPKLISFLAPEFSYYLRRSTAAKPAPVSDQARLRTFLSHIHSPRKADQLDTFEPNRLSLLNFGAAVQPPVGVPAIPSPPTPPQGAISEPAENWVLAEPVAPEVTSEVASEQERPLKRRVNTWRTPRRRKAR